MESDKPPVMPMDSDLNLNDNQLANKLPLCSSNSILPEEGSTTQSDLHIQATPMSVSETLQSCHSNLDVNNKRELSHSDLEAHVDPVKTYSHQIEQNQISTPDSASSLNAAFEPVFNTNECPIPMESEPSESVQFTNVLKQCLDSRPSDDHQTMCEGVASSHNLTTTTEVSSAEIGTSIIGSGDSCITAERTSCIDGTETTLTAQAVQADHPLPEDCPTESSHPTQMSDKNESSAIYTDPEQNQEASQVDPYFVDQRYKISVSDVPQLAWETDLQKPQAKVDNFLRGCKWSPGGSHLVANTNDNCLRVYDQTSFGQPQSDCGVLIREGSQIYDFCWLPEFSSGELRVTTTCSGIPIHLWDAVSGVTVASYRAYDQNDEITAAYSLGFSPDGSKIYAGYNKTIRVFNTERPGRDCKTVPTFDSKSKYGQNGIISCFSHMNGLYAAGSYTRLVGVYEEESDRLIYMMEGHRGGVTHVQFSPDGVRLYTGGRKDPEILVWDLRKPDVPLCSLLRDVKTNQRMYFDLTWSGRYLCSGNHDGSVSVWDTHSPAEEVNGEMFLTPCCQFQAHNDCVSSVSFNHQQHLLATGSGQRHFQNFDVASSSDSSDDDEQVQTAVQPVKDFSLKIWSIAQDTLTYS